jgi:hypothetical protein
MAAKPNVPFGTGAFKPGLKPGIAPFKLGFSAGEKPAGPPGKTGPMPPFVKPGSVSPAAAGMKPGSTIPAPPGVKPAEPALPPKVNPAPVVTEAEAKQLMVQVNAEMAARASLDIELQQLIKETEDSVVAQVPQNVDAFKQACNSQFEQFSNYSGHVTSTASEAAEFARQVQQEVSKTSIRPVGPQAPLNTDELSRALNDILAQAEASFTQLCATYEGIYSTDVTTLGEHASVQWGMFDAKYQTVVAKMEEVKAKHSL